MLFVTGLNPITAADDLRLIFSRFGTVLLCDLLPDQTGRSGRAFLQFSRPDGMLPSSVGLTF